MRMTILPARMSSMISGVVFRGMASESVFLQGFEGEDTAVFLRRRQQAFEVAGDEIDFKVHRVAGL